MSRLIIDPAGRDAGGALSQILPADGSVSYTQLDVYKRQAMWPAGSMPRRAIPTIPSRGQRSRRQLRRAQPYLQAVDGRGQGGLRVGPGILVLRQFPDGIQQVDPGPVSYTHLDVYKRQVPS